MAKVFVALCLCLCLSVVSCQFGFFPSRQERRQDGLFGFNFLPDNRRITTQLAGILHLSPENQNTKPSYVYPFDRRPGVTNERPPDRHQHSNPYGQNQYYNNNQYGQYNPNQYGQYNPNQYGQYNPNQYGQYNPNQSGQYGQNNQNVLFGQDNQNVPFGQNNQNVPVGQNNQNVPFGQNNQNVPFGQNNQNVPFGQNNQNVPFGQSNQNVPFGQPNQNVSFGQTNQNVPFGQDNQNVPFGQSNQNVPFGQTNQNVPFGQSNQNVPFGQSNQNVPFGQSNQNVPFGQPNRDEQNVVFGQNNDNNQGGQVDIPTSDPTQVKFVDNFNQPDPPSGSYKQEEKSKEDGADVTNPPLTVPQLPSVLPELTPVPTTFENRNNFDSASIFQAPCQTVNNGVGGCKSLLQCPEYLRLAQDSRSNANAIQILRRAHCGFEGNYPKVCCPLQGIPTAAPETPAPVVTTTTTTPAPIQPSGPTGADFVDALPEPPICGVSNASFSRVVGGVKAKLGDFPWMALLGYKSRRGPGARWLCGGSLVTNKHVLTAAHCINGHEDDLFVVRLGELDLESDTEGATPVDVPIKEKIKHEEYSPSAFTNDIGILVLERTVQFTSLIRPLCIPKDSELRARSFEDYNPIIAGWGDTEFQGPSATHLQALQLPVVSNDFCAQAYSQYKKQKIDERVLCAGYKKGGRDACQGDSGGPLMQPIWNDVTYTTYFYQIGVVSFGKKCAEAGFPGVYSRVTFYVPWLEQKLLNKA